MKLRPVLLSFALLVGLNSEAQKCKFIAMEYVGGISNRILKVWVTDSLIFAAKVKGPTSESTNIPSLVNTLLSETGMAIDPSDRSNPEAYVNQDKAKKYIDVDFNKITPDEFLKISSNGFVIARKDIIKFYHNPKKKWGMGRYPHNGRLFIESKKSRHNSKEEREFILIGDQDEIPILDCLNK